MVCLLDCSDLLICVSFKFGYTYWCLYCVALCDFAGCLSCLLIFDLTCLLCVFWINCWLTIQFDVFGCVLAECLWALGFVIRLFGYLLRQF